MTHAHACGYSGGLLLPASSPPNSPPPVVKLMQGSIVASTVQPGLQVLSRTLEIQLEPQDCVVVKDVSIIVRENDGQPVSRRRRHLLQMQSSSAQPKQVYAHDFTSYVHALIFFVFQVYWYSSTENVWNSMESAYDVQSASINSTVTPMLASTPGFLWLFVIMQAEAPLTSSLYVQPATTPAPPTTDRRNDAPSTTTDMDMNVIIGAGAGAVVVLGIAWYCLFGKKTVVVVRRVGATTITRANIGVGSAVHSLFIQAGVPSSEKLLQSRRNLQHQLKSI